MYLYELPTTGAIAFADFLYPTEPNNAPSGNEDDDITAPPPIDFTHHLAASTQARANLRAVLKESKRADDGERDWVRIVKALDDYLPYLYAIINAVDHDRLLLRSEPVFSWRTTLSSSSILSLPQQKSPRLDFPSLYSDLLFSHLTQAFALSNTAHSIVSSLGSYEHERHISEEDRKRKDERLNQAVALLCKASGIFSYLASVGFQERIRGGSRTPEMSREVLNALSKLALADAQSLAIRKLLSKSAQESALTPGPPLPKSHPSPVLIAKLYLEILEGLGASRSLAKTPGATPSSANSSSSRLKFGKRDKDKEGDLTVHGDVSPDLRRYLSDETTFASAMSHKWLGVDAGEQGKSGEAVGFLRWAKEELDTISGGGSKEKEKHKGKKERLALEAKSIETFLKGYTKQNDSLHFQPVPKVAELQGMIPSGRAAVAAKKFEPPPLAFGQSIEALEEGTAKLKLENDDVHYY